jgi:phosphoserine aminotransferase
MNLLKTNGSAAYINTGTWSDKAIKEAEKFGEINIIGSSKDKNYSYIPKNLNCPEGMDYLHFTSNNTIFGTQFQDFPIVSANTLLVCDMSSDIFSRKFNISKFDLIYAGAQKNMGPAGTTLVIVKDEILQQTGRDIPSMLDYSIHIKKESMFNTPPVFPIYVSMLTLEWLKNNGGVEWIEQINKQKAELLYNEIDQNYLFEGVAAKEDRSKMNVTFILTDKSKEEEFDRAWHNAGINGLKGHRSVGGYRASMYNALPLSSVQILVDVMHNL